MTSDPGDESRWLTERRSTVGASEIGSILGVNPYSKVVEIWTSKVHPETVERRETDAMRLGRAMEPVVASEYLARHPESTLEDPGRFALARHPQYPFIGATVDRLIDEDGVLECKTAGAHMSKFWASGPPLTYQWQLQQQLLVTGRPWGVIACLIGGRDYVEFRYESDPLAHEVIVRACSDFWGWYVACAEQPPDTFGFDLLRDMRAWDNDSELVRDSYLLASPRSERVRTADPIAANIVAAILERDRVIEEATKSRNSLIRDLVAHVGEFDRLELPGKEFAYWVENSRDRESAGTPSLEVFRGGGERK